MYDYIKRMAILIISGSIGFAMTSGLATADDQEVFDFRMTAAAGEPHLDMKDVLTISPAGKSGQYLVCPKKAAKWGHECKMLQRISGKLPGGKKDKLEKRISTTKSEVKKTLKKTINESKESLDRLTRTYLLEIYADGHLHDFLVWLVDPPPRGRRSKVDH